MRAGLLLLALLAALLPGAGTGQREAPVGVYLAALRHVRTTLPAGPAAVDAEAFCTARLVGWSCPPRVREVADSLGVSLHSREFALVCLGGPATCRLIGSNSLVVLGDPEVSGRTASLLADVWWRSGDRARPVSHRRTRLRLTQGTDGWQVTGREPLVPR